MAQFPHPTDEIPSMKDAALATAAFGCMIYGGCDLGIVAFVTSEMPPDQVFWPRCLISAAVAGIAFSWGTWQFFKSVLLGGRRNLKET